MEFLQLFVLKKLNLVPGKVEKLREQTKLVFIFLLPETSETKIKDIFRQIIAD